MPPPAPGTSAAGPSPLAAARELPRQGPWRVFLLVIPGAVLAGRRVKRLAALPLPPEGSGRPGPDAARRRRLEEAVATESRDRLAEEATEALLRGLGLAPEVPPRTDILAEPPGAADLLLRVGVLETPAIAAPDPAGLVPDPDPAPAPAALAAAAAAELAAIAAEATAWREQPPGTPAAPGDVLVCDLAASLAPQVNRIPQPGLRGAAPGAPGRLPEGWTFGDNGAGLAMEVVAVSPGPGAPGLHPPGGEPPEDAPPHLRLRVQGTPAADGQSFVIWQPTAAEPGSTWVGSLALRPVGTPEGLRGGKLRLYSTARDGTRLQRKDAALAHATAAAAPGGFGRLYVSSTFGAPDTAQLFMVLLIDHAAGRLDVTFDLAAPRLVEGLDLGQGTDVPLPRLSGAGLRLAVGEACAAGLAPDPLGLGAAGAGMAAGEVREVALRLTEGIGDHALTGRTARIRLAARAVLRRETPDEKALAAALGLADVAALRAAARARALDRLAAAAAARRRAAVLERLEAAAAGVDLPGPLVAAELRAIWPGLVAGGLLPAREAAEAAARRSLRRRLATEALARRLGLAVPAAPPGEAPEAAAARRAALEASVVEAVLALPDPA